MSLTLTPWSHERPLTLALTAALTFALAAALTACGADDAAAAKDTATAAEVSDAAGSGDTASADDGAASDAGGADAGGSDAATDAADAGPAFDCAAYCEPFAVCSADVPQSLCVALCSEADTAEGAEGCLTSAADCDAFVDCMLGLKVPLAPPTRSFDDGPTGMVYRDLVGDFTIPTDKGDWSFKAHYDGNESYIFIFSGKGWYVGSDGTDYGTKLHDDATGADLKAMLNLAPKHTHFFFIGYRDQNGANNAAQYVAGFKSKLEPVLAAMSPLDRAWWKQHLHFATAPAPIANEPISVPKTLGGWLGSYTQKKAPRVFAIDRMQRLRQIGLLSVVGQKKWLVQHLAFEAQYYDYEVARAAQYPSEGVKEVVLLDNEVYKGPYIEVDLPPASEMATYDTLEIDHAQMCKDHDDTNCFEWDYLAWLKLVERPVVEDNPYADMTCTVEVKEVVAADEVMGACEGGEQQGAACKAAADCEGGSCKGYKAAIAPVAPVAGDTKSCQCITPRQETVERSHVCQWKTKAKAEKLGSCEGGDAAGAACKADADCPASSCKGYAAPVDGVSGYGACGCQTIEMDVQRWVTTYHREGRWVNDASHNLHHLAKGGKVRFAYKPAYPYISTLKLRLRKTGKGPGAAAKVVPLFTGGGFGKNYNDKYEPVVTKIPAGAKRVEILVDVSGHGFGKDTANCAEFCNHTHHFTVKGGAGEKTWVRDQPYVGNNYGCAQQVPLGVVPNQFGTWTLGRGGWCPGQEIPTTVWDVSAVAKAGDEVTITYAGMLGGKPYDPVPYDSPGGGFGARIDLKSWLLIYE